MRVPCYTNRRVSNGSVSAGSFADGTADRQLWQWNAAAAEWQLATTAAHTDQSNTFAQQQRIDSTGDHLVMSRDGVTTPNLMGYVSLLAGARMQLEANNGVFTLNKFAAGVSTATAPYTYATHSVRALSGLHAIIVRPDITNSKDTLRVIDDVGNIHVRIPPDFSIQLRNGAADTPETDTARLFVRDNGGVQELCVRFANDTIKVIADDQ